MHAPSSLDDPTMHVLWPSNCMPRLALLINTNECRCEWNDLSAGADLNASRSAYGPSTACTIRCSGNQAQICGGAWALSLDCTQITHWFIIMPTQGPPNCSLDCLYIASHYAVFWDVTETAIMLCCLLSNNMLCVQLKSILDCYHA